MPVSISLDDKIATDIVIPSTVTNIKDYAFYQCDDLKKVVISYSVTSIGKFAFRGCTSIESIKLSNKLSSIGYGAFSNCSRLINVGLPNSLKTIGDGTFYGCSTLTDIAFPSSLENIIASDGYPVLGISSIFSGCDKLAHIDIPDSVPITTGLNLSDTAYYKNEDNWIDGVLYIGNHLIECKKDIEGDVYIKDGTLYIHCGSFENRDNLKNVTVPGSVVSIGSVRASGPAGVSGAFAYCDSLETVTLNNGIKKIGMLTFKDCDNLKNIIIPDSVIEIYDYAFAECDNLESAAIGRGVQKIGYQMFANCSHLKSVSFTDSVTEIAFYAFSECNNLKDVYFAGSEDQWKLIKIQQYNETLRNATIHYANPPQIAGNPEITVDNNIYTINIPLESVEYKSNVIAVTYDDGATTGIGQDIILVGDTSISIKVEADSANIAKIFIWNSLEGMHPLCEAVEVPVE